MNELTIKINGFDYFNEEFIKYINLLDGVNGVEINLDDEEIYIQYDKSVIGIGILKMELLLFLSLLNVPFIDGFDKHSKMVLYEYLLVIKDLCCEYCIRGMIDELLMIDGIDKVNHNFDNINKKDVIINIRYG